MAKLLLIFFCKMFSGKIVDTACDFFCVYVYFAQPNGPRRTDSFFSFRAVSLTYLENSHKYILEIFIYNVHIKTA